MKKLQETSLFVKSAPGSSCQEVSRREAGAPKISCRTPDRTPGNILEIS